MHRGLWVICAVLTLGAPPAMAQHQHAMTGAGGGAPPLYNDLGTWSHRVTGSRMDQVIFEEFKGTGNSEIYLSRELAERRIYPAIDLAKSGTRKEEKLYPSEIVPKLHLLRRGLAGLHPQEAMTKLLELLTKWKTNEEIFELLKG